MPRQHQCNISEVSYNSLSQGLPDFKFLRIRPDFLRKYWFFSYLENGLEMAAIISIVKTKDTWKPTHHYALVFVSGLLKAYCSSTQEGSQTITIPALKPTVPQIIARQSSNHGNTCVKGTTRGLSGFDRLRERITSHFNGFYDTAK